jgi:tetratricopeptide (TPR) repeat protein
MRHTRTGRAVHNTAKPGANTKQDSARASITGGSRSASDSQSRFRLRLLGAALLASAIIALYAPILHSPFIKLDDADYVTQNPHVRAGLTWSTAVWAFTTTEAGNWHPLTWLSHAADVQMFGVDPAGHHGVNLLLHAVNAMLLFAFWSRATGRYGRAFLVAALFAVHPLNVESVAWVAERKNLLSMFFSLSCLLAYVAYVRQPGLGKYMLVASTFAAALMAKPMAITLPCVLLLLDYWPFGRVLGIPTSQCLAVKQVSLRRLMVEKLPLFGLSAASAVATIMAQQVAVASIQQFSFPIRLENALYSYAIYAWKTLWPTSLALPYPHPGGNLATWKWALALLFLVTASFLAWSKRKGHEYLPVGWLWFLGALVPVIGIIQVGSQAMADRYAYLPLVGLFVVVAWGGSDLCDSMKIGPWPRWVLSAIALSALAFVAREQIGYWRSDYDLWSHTLAVTRDNFMAEDNLGAALADMGRLSGAFPHFERAASLNPLDDVSHLNMGAMLAQSGKLREAIPQYEAAIRVTASPRVKTIAYSDLGTVYSNLGDEFKARDSYSRALRVTPDYTPAREGLRRLGER